MSIDVSSLAQVKQLSAKELQLRARGYDEVSQTDRRTQGVHILGNSLCCAISIKVMPAWQKWCVRLHRWHGT